MIKVMVSIASYQRRRPEQGTGPLRHGLLSRPMQLRDVNFDGCGGWVQNTSPQEAERPSCPASAAAASWPISTGDSEMMYAAGSVVQPASRSLILYIHAMLINCLQSIIPSTYESLLYAHCSFVLYYS
jgi:hypothetical protein